MATLVERAERKSRMVAIVSAAMAAAAIALLIATMGAASDTWRGFQTGLTAAALLYLSPLLRWFMPRALRPLMNDEGTRAHRHLACTAGLVAAVVSAFAMAAVAQDHPAIGASDTARVIMTAGVAAALFCFATLELRAAR